MKGALLLSLVGAAWFAAPVSAQCPQPDGLGIGQCCTVAQPSFPVPPGFKQDSIGICWRDCDVEAFENCRAEWSTTFATTTACRGIRQKLVLRDSTTGAVKWRGRISLRYSRTWLETDAAGNNMQVWRYLANGDLRPTTNAGLTPCPVPPCASANGNRVRFTGYVDYVEDCSGGSRQHAWMLTHACDVIDHAPNFPRAGFFHPNRTYTFLGPSASFAIGPIQPLVEGGTSVESVRRLRFVPGTNAYECEYEEQIDCGLDPIQELCICGFPTAPLQWAISDLGLASACGTQITTPGGPFLPGYISMGIGAWTDPATYPGLETLRWNGGGYDYFDPCTGVTREEVFFGVATLGGYFATRIIAGAPGFPLPPDFIDQANSLRAGATIMNVRFESDHILNLNFERP